MSVFRVGRRLFLRGAGASVLLPTLSSLLPREVAAQAVSAPRRIMFLGLNHFTPEQKWPAASLATQALGADAKEATLSSLPATALPVLAHPVLQALRARGLISLVSGLDMLIDQSGHGNLGTSALSASLEYQNNQWYPAGPYASVDTVMEASSALYPSGTPTNTVRALRVSLNDTTGFALSLRKSGSVVTPVAGFTSAAALYSAVFSGLTAPPTPMPADRTPTLERSVLQQVNGAYRDVRASRRLSADDRLRLDEHVQLFAELEAALMTTTPPPSATCTAPSAPGATSSYLQTVPLCMRLMSAAMKCGLTKIGVFSTAGHGNLGIPGLPAGGYHNDVVHGAIAAPQKDAYYETYARFHVDSLAQDYLSSLDVEEPGTNRSYLENMLTVVTHEHGFVTQAENDGHPNVNHVVTLIGSLGGRLRTNKFLVFPRRSGVFLPYNTLLITWLEAMGVPASEYRAVSGNQGFGPYSVAGSTTVPASYLSGWGHRLYSSITELVQ